MANLHEISERIRTTDLYTVESAKVAFAIELNRLLEASKLKQIELAHRLGVSSPMVSKLLRGDANVTIETMAKAARALGAKLSVKLVSEHDAVAVAVAGRVSVVSAAGGGPAVWLVGDDNKRRAVGTGASVPMVNPRIDSGWMKTGSVDSAMRMLQ